MSRTNISFGKFGLHQLERPILAKMNCKLIQMIYLLLKKNLNDNKTPWTRSRKYSPHIFMILGSYVRLCI
jgi:hypothetical protein